MGQQALLLHRLGMRGDRGWRKCQHLAHSVDGIERVRGRMKPRADGCVDDGIPVHVVPGRVLQQAHTRADERHLHAHRGGQHTNVMTPPAIYCLASMHSAQISRERRGELHQAAIEGKTAQAEHIAGGRQRSRRTGSTLRIITGCGPGESVYDDVVGGSRLKEEESRICTEKLEGCWEKFIRHWENGCKGTQDMVILEF
ncbi:hypothetical protein FB451DRAFT_1192909 [Mycena latifolia]|nr:hypothetical protein FB451DRAFT_1192909 [Mycena latifolia]